MEEDNGTAPIASVEETKRGLLEPTRATIATVGARMVARPPILAPLIAFIALHSPIKVLDYPIFIQACLIAGSPPFLTLAQNTAQTAHRNGLTDVDAITERLTLRSIFLAYTILATPLAVVLVLVTLLVSANDYTV